MSTRDNKRYMPGDGTGAFSSEKVLSVTKGFTDRLRFGRSLTEAQDLEKAGQGISVKKRRE